MAGRSPAEQFQDMSVLTYVRLDIDWFHVTKGVTWRIIHRIDTDAIVILEVFAKKSQRTPKHVIDTCKSRLRRYDES